MVLKDTNTEQNTSNSKSISNYFSIRDIEDCKFRLKIVEIGPELKSEDIKLDRLLELFISGKKRYEFYVILKKINNQISSKEFNEEKLITFKEMVIGLLEEFLNTSTSGYKMDKITIPYLFSVLKKSFFKLKLSSKRRVADSSITKNVDFHSKNSDLMVKSFDLAIRYLTNEQEDIILAALNYLFKFLDEPMNITPKGGSPTTVKQFLI
jgi:hypothetical protein